MHTNEPVFLAPCSLKSSCQGSWVGTSYNHLSLHAFLERASVTCHWTALRGVIKNYGECCCRVRSNRKAGMFNTGSGVSNLSNSVWQV